MEPVLLYITASTREEAISLSRELLGLKLVACTNITEHVTSLYHWQGEIEQKTEAVIIAKTLNCYVEEIVTRVKSIHSYNTPCVLVLPVTGGNAEFIDWIGGQTGPLP